MDFSHKTARIANLAIRCGDLRPIPRTGTFEFAIEATLGNNQHTPKVLKLEPTNRIISEPQPSINLPSPQVEKFKESMKQLLDMVLAFFEEEQRKVDEGLIELEKSLAHALQKDDTDTKRIIRSLPEGFKRKRA